MKEERSILLHSCCGPCSTAVIEKLEEVLDITIYFFNPNITEPAEYEKRKQEQLRFLTEKNQKSRKEISFMKAAYDPQVFYQMMAGLEAEPEGGLRCNLCFALRLKETAMQAKQMGFDYFGTTLTVSPHKNAKNIHAIGNEIAAETGVAFWEEDFKKKDGYKRSIAISNEYNLYRQNYCGCTFSKINR